ncbi:MAG: efflux RND transporter permease subunit [Bacteroidales bacterium]|nr:efflux RND transporter permease subunit [Bacteroidales bacterium]
MRKKRGIASVVEWSISHKGILYFLVGVLAVTGVVGIYFMNKDEFPTFEIKQGLIVGIYPGADAAEVEQQLAIPLEKALFSFSEIERSNTTVVCRDGACFIYADLGINIPQSQKDEIWSKIKLKLNSIRALLPPGVLGVTVVDDFGDVSATLLAIRSSDKGPAEVLELAEELSDEIRSLNKTASVSIVGALEEEMAVTLDRDRISAYGIDPTAIMLSFRSSSLSAPSGIFSTAYANSPVHIGSDISTEQELLDKIIYSDPSGAVVRLRDIASVEKRIRKADYSVAMDGEPCVILSVVMRPDNDIVSYGREIDRIISRFSAELPESVSIFKVTDQPDVVSTSVFSFLRDLGISMLVVILVMLLLFPLRSASIASSGLPIITAITLAIMFVAGIDLNTVTLAALITVLGMIVDDSIITMDGYMDKLGRGLDRVEAACESAKELFFPTFIATLAISTMFFPIKGILTGYLKDFVKFFPWVIGISLMVSLVYAVTVVPSLEVRFISGRQESPNLITRAQNLLFTFIERAYSKALRWCFRLPVLTVAGGIAVVALGIFMFTRINVQMMPLAARDYFIVEIETEGGNGIAKTAQIADSLSSILRQDSRVRYVTSFSGAPVPRFTGTFTPRLPLPTMSQLVVKTSSYKATEAMLRECQPKMEHLFPEAIVRFKQIDYQAVLAPVVVTLRGDDREMMLPAADAIKKEMASMDDLLQWVHSDADDYVPVVDIDLDPDESGRLGVDKTMLSLQLAGTLGGLGAGEVQCDGKMIPVRLYSSGVTDDMFYDQLSSQMVATRIPGVSVPLRQVASLRPDARESQLTRNGGKESISISADLKCGASQPEALRRIKAFTDNSLILPDGVSMSFEGLSMMNRQIGPRVLISFIVAVSILFLFLLFHFRKVSIAVLTMVMSSVCLFGAFFGLWLFKLDFGLTAVLGLVSLVGIVVRNGILMYEYAEDRRLNHGADSFTAALEAGKRRVRPIFLTSCTTALGVLPMVLSKDILWQPMGVIICFGTILSIVFIVLLMPVCYWLIFKHAK